jgi:hypothetical protein
MKNYMPRRKLMLGLAVLLTLPRALMAQNAPDQIVKQLHTQGYTTISVERTWLGRTRILASNPEAQREIIVNPTTGEILRDFWKPLAVGASAARSDRVISDSDSDDSSSSSGSGSGSGSGSDDDDSDNSGSDHSDSSGSGHSGGGDDGESDDDKDSSDDSDHSDDG